MRRTANQTHKLVTFSQEPSDQALLGAIAQSLVQQPQRNFSQLCKQALQQYFLADRTPPTAGGNSGARAIRLFMQIQRQMTELQNRVLTLEQQVTVEHSERLEQLELQLSEMNQCFEQLEIEQLDSTAIQPLPEMEPAPIYTPRESREVDPLLVRLGRLVDDF